MFDVRENPKETNVLVLAYLGDAIYENYIRKYVIRNFPSNPKILQQEAVKYVSAKAQAEAVIRMMHAKILTDDEVNIIRRARNHKMRNYTRKNCTMEEYRLATGLEAMIGYLDLVRQEERIVKLIDYIVGGLNVSVWS